MKIALHIERTWAPIIKVKQGNTFMSLRIWFCKWLLAGVEKEAAQLYRELETANKRARDINTRMRLSEWNWESRGTTLHRIDKLEKHLGLKA